MIHNVDNSIMITNGMNIINIVTQSPKIEESRIANRYKKLLEIL